MLDRQKQIEYCYMRKHKMKPIGQVKTKLKCKKVIKIEAERILRVWYPVFTILREDDKIWTFSEAEFPNIELNIFHSIVFMLRRETVRPRDNMLGLNAVYRHLKTSILWAYVTDLRLGIESWQSKINKIKPRRLTTKIEEHNFYSVIDDGRRFGVFYKDSIGEKKFMRHEELGLYCDGTLKIVKKELEKRLKLSDERSVPLSEADKDKIIRMLTTIDEKILYRDYIRVSEIMFAMRRKFPTLS